MDRGPLPPKGSMGGSPRFQDLLYSSFLCRFWFSRSLSSKVQVGRCGSSNCFPSIGRDVLFFQDCSCEGKMGRSRLAERHRAATLFGLLILERV